MVRVRQFRFDRGKLVVYLQRQCRGRKGFGLVESWENIFKIVRGCFVKLRDKVLVVEIVIVVDFFENFLFVRYFVEY